MASTYETQRNKPQGRRVEVIMTSSPPVRLSCITVHCSIKELWLLHITSYWGKHLHCLHSSCHRRLLLWKNSQLQLLPPSPAPKWSPRPKRWHPLPDPMESMPMGRTTTKTTLGGPLSPKRQETPPLFQTLKPSCAEAFSQDSDMVKEARKEFFSKCHHIFTMDGACNLSRIFRHLAVSADLSALLSMKSNHPELGQMN